MSKYSKDLIADIKKKCPSLQRKPKTAEQRKEQKRIIEHNKRSKESENMIFLECEADFPSATAFDFCFNNDNFLCFHQIRFSLYSFCFFSLISLSISLSAERFRL